MKKYSLRVLQMAYLGALKKEAKDVNKVCRFCWNTVENDKCKECGAEMKYKYDSFLNLDGYELQF
jgi:rRNA maturation endonuclease Nob1